jgi:putative tryptophan/tyrosine transport system substrate-binding protein
MDRRAFLTLALTGLSVLSKRSSAAVPARIGWLSPISQEASAPWLQRFESRMAELGWVRPQISFDYKYANGDMELARNLAREIFSGKPDVAVTYNTRLAQIMRPIDPDVPMVVFLIDDPVAAGLAIDITRPGLRTTGVYWKIDRVVGKQIALLRELAPTITHLGVLAPKEFSITSHLNAVVAEGTSRNFAVSQLRFETPQEFDGLFQSFKASGGDAVYVILAPATASHEAEIAAAAQQCQLITVGEQEAAVQSGLLFSYTARRGQSERLIADQVDRVLKGADPSTIPFIQPIDYVLVWNSRTAGLLQIEMPASFEAQIDEAIP